MKDTKATTGKKKRSLSEDELRPGKDGKASNAGPSKNSKNKKVNQEKEGRKNQKVILIFITNNINKLLNLSLFIILKLDYQ